MEVDIAACGHFFCSLWKHKQLHGRTEMIGVEFVEEIVSF